MNSKLREWALVGMNSRLEKMQEELSSLKEMFTELFGPVAAPASPRETKAAAARKLIEGAEKIRKKAAKKKHAKRNYATTHPQSDPTGETMLVREAAKFLGLSNWTIYQHLNSGTLEVANKDERGTKRLRRSDVEAFGETLKNRNIEVQVEEQAALIQ